MSLPKTYRRNSRRNIKAVPPLELLTSSSKVNNAYRKAKPINLDGKVVDTSPSEDRYQMISELNKIANPFNYLSELELYASEMVLQKIAQGELDELVEEYQVTPGRIIQAYEFTPRILAKALGLPAMKIDHHQIIDRLGMDEQEYFSLFPHSRRTRYKTE